MNEEDKELLKKEFWRAIAIRALRTFAQTLAGTITVGMAFHEWNWKINLSIAVIAGVFTVLTGIAYPKAITEIKPRHSAE